jgi:succinate-acetate transporter protein
MSNTIATHHSGTTAGETAAVPMPPTTTSFAPTYWNLSGDPEFVAEPGFPTYHRRIANPGPLGMFAQAVSLFLWGLYIVRARGVAETSFFVGMALAVGGIVEFLAGMWEFRTGNTFAATQFSMFGGFWFSLGLNYIPGTGAITSYGVANTDIFGTGGDFQFHQAVGFLWLVWFLFSFMLWLASFRSSIVLSSKLFLTWLMFLLLMSGEFTGHYTHIKAGGGIAIAAACFSFYQATAALMTHETSFFPLHRGLGELPKWNSGSAAGRAGNKY